ncbi:MAG TPA: ATP-binding cassette domain-containing protein [Planctomycetota bacterium]|nr:ATP-binding cassette domain-containing protein [Planctomycetota bacterium]
MSSAPNAAPATPDPKGAAQPMIRAEGLVKHYGDVRAVEGVSFEVGRGEIVGFLGPNGAGKSTTMRMLTGYLYPDQGRVHIAGHDVAQDGQKARASLGYLPESTPLYRDMRVDRYLQFVGELRGLDRVQRQDALERVFDATDLAGYTQRKIGTLSKGYRQRVGLAQALISDPDVLILDEPTSGLDPAEIVRVRDRIVALAETKTILLSTHVLPEVEEVCRRVIILAGGRIVADGSLLELSAGREECLLVTLVAPEQEALAACAEVPGVLGCAVSGRGASGRLRLHLDVSERFDVAERLSALAVERGWPLLELRHDVPTLERVFLECTRSAGEEQTP